MRKIPPALIPHVSKAPPPPEGPRRATATSALTAALAFEVARETTHRDERWPGEKEKSRISKVIRER